jgi:teichuronic acid exporter
MSHVASPRQWQKINKIIEDLRQDTFARNLSSLGGAQLAIRFSRLATTIFLSRLLLPEQFGLAAVVLTVYELIALFTRNGISAKIVQVSAEELPFVALTAYRLTWIICITLMIVQVLVAWPIAWFYKNTSIALPIAAMSIIYLATPLCNIQAAFQQREGNLTRFALAGAVQVIADNLLTVVFAFLGYGMWAIILPKILVAPIWVVFIRSGHPWRPHTSNSPYYFFGWKEIMRFSRRVLGVELLVTLQANIDNFFVGYFLGMHALGLYYFAFNSGLGITLGLLNAASVAVYPHLCEVRLIREALITRSIKAMKTIGILIIPIIMVQVLLAPIYVPIVFGEKWVEAVPVLALICLSALIRPFANVMSQLLKAVGHPEIELKWQLLTTVTLTFGLIIGCQLSIFAVAFAVFAVQTVMLAAFVFSARKFVLSEKFNIESIGKSLCKESL